MLELVMMAAAWGTPVADIPAAPLFDEVDLSTKTTEDTAPAEFVAMPLPLLPDTTLSRTETSEVPPPPLPSTRKPLALFDNRLRSTTPDTTLAPARPTTFMPPNVAEVPLLTTIVFDTSILLGVAGVNRMPHCEKPKILQSRTTSDAPLLKRIPLMPLPLMPSKTSPSR